MIVLDTSALVAILFDEPERRAFSALIEAADERLLSAANLLEASILVEARRGEHAGRELDLLVHRAAVDVRPVDAAQVEVARRAWRRFGKGRHPAALNLGDCFAYALATNERAPLLFKGEDFAQTDVRVVARR